MPLKNNLVKVLIFSVGYIFLGQYLDMSRFLNKTDGMAEALSFAESTFREDLDQLDVLITNYAALAASPAPQTLDELIVEDDFDLVAIAKLTKKLKTNFQRLHRQMDGVNLQHRHIFEASREEVIRIFTMGITGFDTPGTGAALREAEVALRQLATVFEAYTPTARKKAPAALLSVISAFEQGHKHLAEGDFTTLDRLSFLRDVVNPLTRELPRIQAALEIESIADYKELPHPVNPAASHLFDEDFLNAEYYANLSPGGKGETRRALGELLFFDPVLSNNLKTSCASCHQPAKAFTDGRSRSLATDGQQTVERNSPTLINSVYADKYFYDLREDHLERQIKHVVASSLEFATDFVTIEQRLRQSPEYVRLFEKAYSDQPNYALSKWSISDALGNYILSLRANNSNFDRYARGDEEELDESIRRGFNLFMGKATCGTCHFAPSFSGLVPPYYSENESEVLGVPADSLWTEANIDEDLGRIASKLPRDEAYFNAFAFKTPTIRNAQVTGPYMHNGVYSNLRQVMDFYNRGGGAGIGIDLPHQTLPGGALELTQGEIFDVISFMESLTDYEALNKIPEQLPTFPGQPTWNERSIGGSY